MIRRLRAPALLALLAVGGCTDPAAPVGGALAYAACVPTDAYWPTGGWRSTCPAAVQLDTVGLRGALDVIRDSMPSARSLIVARRGYIALEAYYHGARAGSLFEIRSITKAFTATVVGAAIEQGRIPGVDQRIEEWFPDYLQSAADARKRTITIEHLLDLDAGFDLNAPGTDQRSYAAWILSRPLIADPGTAWSYDEALYDLLSMIVGRATGTSMVDLARARLFAPLGMPGAAGRWPTDDDGTAYGASGLRLTARELLKLGQLYLHDGVWDGTRVLPDGWVRDHVGLRPAGAADTDTYWIRGWRQTVLGGHLTYYALGYGGQFLFVVPDLEVVAVATADPYAPESVFPRFGQLLRDHILPAVQR